MVLWSTSDNDPPPWWSCRGLPIEILSLCSASGCYNPFSPWCYLTFVVGSGAMYNQSVLECSSLHTLPFPLCLPLPLTITIKYVSISKFYCRVSEPSRRVCELRRRVRELRLEIPHEYPTYRLGSLFDSICQAERQVGCDQDIEGPSGSPLEIWGEGREIKSGPN
jgi:hypothetical protein